MRLVTCITQYHDLPLVAVAALLCCVGSWVTADLYGATRSSSGRARAAWIFLGAVAAGSTIWCTHFVAMLAYRPTAPVAFAPGLTALSLAVAIIASAIGLAIASARFRLAPPVGGAVFGGGIAAMHYTGMAAFAVDGLMLWDRAYVAASVALAIALSIAGAIAGARGRVPADKRLAAGLLVLAIVSLHFTGMAALTVVPSAAGLPSSDEAMDMLAIAVAGVGLLVLGTGATSYLLDGDARDRAGARLRHLAESTVDGVVIEQDGRIAEVNAAFAALVGETRERLLSKRLDTYLDRDPGDAEPALLRTGLRRADGMIVPVEVAARRETGRAGEVAVVVFAVRDLRPRLEAEQRIAYLAGNDSLTDLPNRASFLDRLERAIVSRGAHESVALLAIDLDRFKEVNDLHGHAAGDAVLSLLAERTRAALRPGEFLARLGGDEFAAVATVRSREEALEFAERLEKPLFSSVDLDHAEVACGASVGVALFPQDADSPTALMNNADLAMYRAKGTLGQVTCFYEGSMDEMVRARRKTMKELRDALQRREFELHYQVQTSVATREVTGYEALLRWRHPERGYVPPMEFIPIAEETGLILPIGDWVLRAACEAAAGWATPHKIAVNLSAVQLASVDLPRVVAQVLADTALSPQRLELEITETALIADKVRATHVLGELKALGVTIAMDDFGTGYSSLSTLRAFPFDKIKLDKSFVSELEQSSQARAIIRAVLALGDSLAIPILAEGVETDDQLDFLRQLGCDEVQGFLLGRPAPRIADEPPARPGLAA